MAARLNCVVLLFITLRCTFGCDFDPCVNPGFCSGGKACVTDVNCNTSCVCSHNSTAAECIQSTNSSDSSSTNSSDINTSPLAMTSPSSSSVAPSSSAEMLTSTQATSTCRCENGQCQDGGGCICDDSDGCFCVECESGFRCEMRSFPFGIYPVCNEDEIPIGPSTDACDAGYALRNESDRLCFGETQTCVYGYCYKEPGIEYCKCDDPAVGLYCEQTCCKNCSGNGICKKNSTTLTESCSCSDGYTGEFCEIKRTCPCVNGQCRWNSFSECDCENGWSGDTCDLECNLNCPANTRCHRIQNTAMTACIPLTPTTTETPTISATLETSNRTYNVCEEAYQQRPLEERTCFSGSLNCHFGRCVTEDLVYCKCDIGVSPGGGQLCREKCCKYCGEHGDCYYNTKLEKEMCNCHDNYTGDLCENKKVFPSTEPHKDPRWVYWVAGVCGFLLVALVILLVIMPYFLWRKRVILVMKLVHYFQGYEDDDDSKWDAFISYKSNTPDEDFVVHTLFPKLARELGFSVNVHFKDFTPGEDITNNIIHAVENSRRTILIVSPNYLASNFAKFEWQTAQQRMLERRHRIIPILLEDVSSYRESMDPNLRQILDSVTYIEWPHDENTTQKKTDKFWKRIELSMPKKKQKSTASPNEYSKDTPTDNTTATFVKPDSVELTMVNGEENSRPPYLHEDSGIYCSINENERPNPEEVYNTINEADIEAKSQGKEHTKNNSNDAYYITPKHTQIAESSNNLENQLTKENLDEREMKFLKILEVDV